MTKVNSDTLGRELIAQNRLWFDSGDPANGSLYICIADCDVAYDLALNVVAVLRQGGGWSDAAPAEVKAEQKALYAEQLEFVSALNLTLEGSPFVIARYDHPKFPSSAARFELWARLLRS